MQIALALASANCYKLSVATNKQSSKHMYKLSFTATTQNAAAASTTAKQLQALFNNKFNVTCVLQSNNYYAITVQRTHKRYNKAVAKFNNTVQQFCNTVQQHICTEDNPVSCYVLCKEGHAVY